MGLAPLSPVSADTPPRLWLRGQGRPGWGWGGRVWPGCVFAVPVPAQRPWPGFPRAAPHLPTLCPAPWTGLFTRPLFPAAKGRQCQQVLFTDSVTKGPCGVSYPTGPWAWSARSLPCWLFTWTGSLWSPGFVTCAAETFTPTSRVSPGSDGSREVVLTAADTLGAAQATESRWGSPPGHRAQSLGEPLNFHCVKRR